MKKLIRRVLYISASAGLLVASLNYILSDCVYVKYWFEKYIEMSILIIISLASLILAWREYIEEVREKKETV
jgi:hypothetical protein